MRLSQLPVLSMILFSVACNAKSREPTTAPPDVGGDSTSEPAPEPEPVPDPEVDEVDEESPAEVPLDEKSEAETKGSDDGARANRPGPASPKATAGKKDKSGQLGGIGSGSAGVVQGYGVGGGGMGRAGVASPSIAQQQPMSDLESNTEDYHHYGVNDFTDPTKDAMSTFAVDVDTASYTIARRKISDGTLPPAASVRVEEWVNYFNYDYASPQGDAAFAVHMDAAPSPFGERRWFLRVGVQARKSDVNQRKPAHLVFLVDVSGSMQSPDKLELAKKSLRMLVDHLHDGDTVAMVTYAGSTRVVLEPTGMTDKGRIHAAIEDLTAGGSTAMASGIDLAYNLAAQTLDEKSETRVIVLSDGDANVGTNSHEEILKTIDTRVKMGITLSVVGFGMGNYKDTLMEQFANKGNGNYFYIDGPAQAHRVFVEQLGGTLETVAKDVKLQVVFDPAVVKGYRLVGYENRDVADKDFRNDKVDAGEIGAGHQVTAFYEVELARTDASPCKVHIRAKKPRGSEAAEQVFAFPVSRIYGSFDAAPADFRFGTTVMASAEILRGSPYAQGWDLAKVTAYAAKAAIGKDTDRPAFVALLQRARGLRGTTPVAARPE